MRLRPLTEEECYARCYGGRREETVAVVWARPSDERREGPPDGRSAEQAEASDAA